MRDEAYRQATALIPPGFKGQISWVEVDRLLERASLMDQHEGLTYERDASRREPFALRSSYVDNELNDDLSIVMVKKIQNRYGVEIWPWERLGFTH